MSSFENNGITAKGNNLLAKVAAGKIKLNYTKAVIGDGSLGQEQTIASLTNLISPKNTVSINRLVAVSGDPAWATVGFVYSNKNITSSYFLREIGIFATDPDEGEILYWYGNAGATADFIKPGDGTVGSDIIEKKFDVGIYVGQSANVTATINGSLVFPTYEEFDAAIAAAKKYTDEKFASIIIESATTSRPGVTKLSNSVTSSSQNEASTPLATKTAMDKANKAEGDAESARQRAVSAEESAKSASLPRTGGTVSGALRVGGELTFADGSTFSQLKQSGVDAKNNMVNAVNAMKGTALTNSKTWAEVTTEISTVPNNSRTNIQSLVSESTAIPKGYYDGNGVVNPPLVRPGSQLIYNPGNNNIIENATPNFFHPKIVFISGVYRITFTLFNGSQVYSLYGQIYKNGSPFGTRRTVLVNGLLSFTEDLPFSANDIFSFGAWKSGAESYGYCYLRDIKVGIELPAYIQ